MKALVAGSLILGFLRGVKPDSVWPPGQSLVDLGNVEVAIEMQLTHQYDASTSTLTPRVTALTQQQYEDACFYASSTLAEAQSYASATLLNNVDQFTMYYPDGGVRYDTNFKFAALIFGMEAGINAPPAPTLLGWMKAVQVYYFTVKAQIMACTMVAEVQAIDISVAGFEAKYGIGGSVLADPNIATAQLMP